MPSPKNISTGDEAPISLIPSGFLFPATEADWSSSSMDKSIKCFVSKAVIPVLSAKIENRKSLKERVPRHLGYFCFPSGKIHITQP